MKARKISTAWTKGLKDEESKDRLRQQLVSNSAIFVRLREIMQSRKKYLKIDSYDNTDWAFKQAHQNGMNEAYDEVIDLITTLTEEQ
jgi:hypothetical protein